MMNIFVPKLYKVKQIFENNSIDNINKTVKKQMADSGVVITKGSSIAITVGSRGIANISDIVKAAVEFVKEQGANPFIIPAMGSHGRATAEGQRSILEGYGVTEEYIGAPIKSSMEVVELPRGNLENKIFMDKFAYESDGVIVINRIKVHTDFHGDFESGLMKMCVIGLGKHKQALEIHRFGVYGLRKLIPSTAREVIKSGKILMGIGLVENAYDQSAIIKAMKPSDIESEEIKLLVQNQLMMPSLPVDNIDILIIDEMGKDISGAGLDTNIIGRMRIRNEKEPEKPDVTSIIVTDITEASHGNAAGVGLADYITKNLFEKIDLKSTYENIVTSTFIERGKIPIIADTAKQALEYAYRTSGPIDIEAARIVRIKNTLHLDKIYVSETILNEIKDKKDIEILGTYNEMFNESNELLDF
jgi:hypothetical protein